MTLKDLSNTGLLTSIVLLMHIIVTHRRLDRLQAQDTTAIDDILVAMLNKED